MDCPPNAKLIPLTHGKFTVVDEDIFDELNQFKWHLDDKGYAQRTSYVGKKHHVRMSRVVINASPEFQVDHISLDRLDNRRCNLRLATREQNGQNRRALSNNRTGIKGVHIKGNKFEARIRINRKLIHIGTFDTARDAGMAYDFAAIKHFGEFALPNFR